VGDGVGELDGCAVGLGVGSGVGEGVGVAVVDGVAVEGIAVEGIAVEGVAVEGVAVDGTAVIGAGVGLNANSPTLTHQFDSNDQLCAYGLMAGNGPGSTPKSLQSSDRVCARADRRSHLGVGDGVGEGVGEGVGNGVGVASKKTDDPVPAIAATAIRRPFTWPAALDMLVQAAEVAEVQLVVEHEALASQSVAEGSDSPNCKPEMVS
jgi:hypothetical protein